MTAAKFKFRLKTLVRDTHNRLGMVVRQRHTCTIIGKTNEYWVEFVYEGRWLLEDELTPVLKTDKRAAVYDPACTLL